MGAGVSGAVLPAMCEGISRPAPARMVPTVDHHVHRASLLSRRHVSAVRPDSSRHGLVQSQHVHLPGPLPPVDRRWWSSARAVPGAVGEEPRRQASPRASGADHAATADQTARRGDRRGRRLSRRAGVTCAVADRRAGVGQPDRAGARTRSISSPCSVAVPPNTRSADGAAACRYPRIPA